MTLQKGAGIMRDNARRFYDSTAWRKTQAAFIASKHYTCERCGRAARIVHHKVYITLQNIDDVNITLSWDNLQALCLPCHNTEHGHGVGLTDGIRFDEQGNLVRDLHHTPPP